MGARRRCAVTSKLAARAPEFLNGCRCGLLVVPARVFGVGTTRAARAGLRAVASSGAAAARDLTLQPPDLDVDGCTALPRRAVQGSSRPKGTVDYTVILDRLLVQFEWLIFFSQER